LQVYIFEIEVLAGDRVLAEGFRVGQPAKGLRW